MACARVSGVAAGLLARHRASGRTAHDVAVALQHTARRLDDADRDRAAAGQIDEHAADRLLAGGGGLPRRRAAVVAAGGTPYVDPRLRWLLDAGDPAQVVRSVVVIDGETVVLDVQRGAYAKILADPRVTAISAPDVPTWTLARGRPISRSSEAPTPSEAEGPTTRSLRATLRTVVGTPGTSSYRA
jgi:hypothetical protein